MIIYSDSSRFQVIQCHCWMAPPAGGPRYRASAARCLGQPDSYLHDCSRCQCGNHSTTVQQPLAVSRCPERRTRVTSTEPLRCHRQPEPAVRLGRWLASVTRDSAARPDLAWHATGSPLSLKLDDSDEFGLTAVPQCRRGGRRAPGESDDDRDRRNHSA